MNNDDGAAAKSLRRPPTTEARRGAPSPALEEGKDDEGPASNDELEGWVVAIDVRNGVVNVEHFPPSSHGQAAASAKGDVPPLRFAFRCSSSKLLQTRVGARVFILPPRQDVTAAAGGQAALSTGGLVGAQGQGGYQLRIPQPKRERDRRGTIVRVVHKGMCIVECTDVYQRRGPTDADEEEEGSELCDFALEPNAAAGMARAHGGGGGPDVPKRPLRRSREHSEQVCLLWSTVDEKEMARIHRRFGLVRAQEDMFNSTIEARVRLEVSGAASNNPTDAAAADAQSDGPPFALAEAVAAIGENGASKATYERYERRFVGTPVRFALHHGTAVIKAVHFLFDAADKAERERRQAAIAARAAATAAAAVVVASPLPSDTQTPAAPTEKSADDLPKDLQTHASALKAEAVDDFFFEYEQTPAVAANNTSSDAPAAGRPAPRGNITWDDGKSARDADGSSLAAPPAEGGTNAIASAAAPSVKVEPANNQDDTNPPRTAAAAAQNQPLLSRGGMKLNTKQQMRPQGPTSAAGDDASNTPSSPLSSPTAPLTAQLGSWEVSGPMLWAYLSLRSDTNGGGSPQPEGDSAAAANPLAITCGYQQMRLENHTPPLVSQESAVALSVGPDAALQRLVELVRAQQLAASPNATSPSKSKKKGGDGAKGSASSVLPFVGAERIRVAIIDDDGDDVTDVVCDMRVRAAAKAEVKTEATTVVKHEENDDEADSKRRPPAKTTKRPTAAAAASATNASTTFDLSVLAFAMEGSCCEIRLKVTIDFSGLAQPAPSVSSASGGDAAEAVLEFTSRPIFVRPSIASLAARRNRFAPSSSRSTAEALASASALFAVSPFAADSSSSKFWTRDFLAPSDLIEDGFIDPGRSNPLLDPDAILSGGGGGGGNMKSKTTAGSPTTVDASTSSAVLATLKEREVLLIDEGRDAALASWVASSGATLRCIMDTRAKVSALAWFVIGVYGGTSVTDDAFDASIARLRFGRDTRRAVGATASSSRSIGGRLNRPAAAAASGAVKQSANTLCLGSIPIGLCRHRALLFKYLSDKCGILCYLVRGTYSEAEAAAGDTAAPASPMDSSSSSAANYAPPSRHSWCVVLTGRCAEGDPEGESREMLLVDCTHPTAPVSAWPARGYACPELPPHVQPIRVADEASDDDENDNPSTTADALAAADSATAAPPSLPEASGAEETLAGVGVAAKQRRRPHCFFAASPHEPVPIRQEDVGRGAVAVVRRATFGGLSCALKVPHCAEDEVDLRREYAILSMFRQGGAGSGNSNNSSGNNGIVQCLGWCDGLVLEYMPFSLLGFMNSLLLRRMALRGAQVREVLAAVTRALVLVHSKGIVHRDVKTENVLLYPERCGDCMRTGVVCPHCSLVAKLADFADCYRLPSGSLLAPPQPVVGTAPYAAPEIEAGAAFGAAADVWSLGILAVELFLMRMPTPFTAGVNGRFAISPYLPEPAPAKKRSSSSIKEKNAPPANGVFVPQLDPATTPAWGVAFAEGCLKVKMEDRLTCPQLLAILEAVVSK